MREFLVVFKKEWREVVRTKKLYIFLGISIGLVVFSFLILGLLQLLASIEGLELGAELMQVFSLTYANATSVMASFFATYFVIVIVIMLRSYMSKEVKERKWLLPLQSGIKPQYLVIARLLAIVATILICALAAFALHFILCLIFCKPSLNFIGIDLDTGNMLYSALSVGESIGNTLYGYAMLLIYILFITILTLGLNAVTKKPSAVVGIMLLAVIVLETVLSSITINIGTVEFSLASFTPFLFSAQAMTKTAVHWSCWLSASLITAGLIALMIFLSLMLVKVKGEKIK